MKLIMLVLILTLITKTSRPMLIQFERTKQSPRLKMHPSFEK